MNTLAVVVAMAVSASPRPAPKPTRLVLSVKPASAVLYVDGLRRGSGSETQTVTVTPGTHVIRVVNGLDEHEEPLTVDAGEQKTWSWEFEDDRPQAPPAAAPAENSEKSSKAEPSKEESTRRSDEEADSALDAWATGRSRKGDVPKPVKKPTTNDPLDLP